MSETAILPATRRGLELLATIKAVDSAGSITTRCFGNILELGCDSMVLESHREQQAGSAVLLSVVFPGRQPQATPVATLQCVVRRVRDRTRLHYDQSIEDMSETARERLIEFLGQPDRQADTRAKDGSIWSSSSEVGGFRTCRCSRPRWVPRARATLTA